jgi:hypothetical protein
VYLHKRFLSPAGLGSLYSRNAYWA